MRNFSTFWNIVTVRTFCWDNSSSFGLQLLPPAFSSSCGLQLWSLGFSSDPWKSVTSGHTWKAYGWSHMGSIPVVTHGKQTGGHAWNAHQRPHMESTPVVTHGAQTGSHTWNAYQWSHMERIPALTHGTHIQKRYKIRCLGNLNNPS